jgi:hypothetical protein
MLDIYGRAWKTGSNPTEKSGRTHGPVPAMIGPPMQQARTVTMAISLRPGRVRPRKT